MRADGGNRNQFGSSSHNKKALASELRIDAVANEIFGRAGVGQFCAGRCGGRGTAAGDEAGAKDQKFPPGQRHGGNIVQTVQYSKTRLVKNPR